MGNSNERINTMEETTSTILRDMKKQYKAETEYSLEWDDHNKGIEVTHIPTGKITGLNLTEIVYLSEWLEDYA